jgi:dTDP-4-amino-4,6-dideoxygalactose transaminase
MTGFLTTALVELADQLTRMPDPDAGHQAHRLEQALADRFGVAHAVAVSSGTTALHTALLGLGIGCGDEVLVPALSVVMSVAPIIYAGARPVFVDCAPDGYDLDLGDLTSKITSRTTAVMPVHLWGRVGDLDRLRAVAGTQNLAVIERRQAQGTAVNDRHRTTGTVGCFSMKDGKILWSGEGGYLLTNHRDLAERCRGLRSHWQTPTVTDHPLQVGYNYRLAEPLAILAYANLARFDELLHRRRAQAALVAGILADTPGLSVVDPGPGWNAYTPLIRVTLPEPRAFCQYVAERGVPNSVGTFGLVSADQRPMFASSDPAPCPNAARLIDHTLAVIVTDRDDNGRVASYAQTIIREAHRWRPRP